MTMAGADAGTIYTLGGVFSDRGHSVTTRLFIKSYGCQMNVYDSERMVDVLAPLGYSRVDRAEDADLIILNTCHIREKAAEKVYSELGRLKILKDRAAALGGLVRLAVAGCVAQAEGEELARRAPFVDLVFGPQTYHRLPAMVRGLAAADGVFVDTEFPPEDKFDHLPERLSGPVQVATLTAFLTVQEGCDRFCTFCVVPYTRGAEVSRPAMAVLAEARRLVAAGVREITLLGQNVNAYHGTAPASREIGSGEWDLARLIDALAEIDGLERIRYTTSYPADMTDSLIEAHRRVPSLMPYVHLPVQSGSDRILKAMNRRHDADGYRRIVDRLRSARPDLALSSDFIVGFPGETEGDFQESLDLIDEVRFAQAFSFKYSQRPGTPASDWDQVEDHVKAERLQILQDRLAAHQSAFNRDCVGRVLPVLIEGKGRKVDQLTGRSPYLQPVHVDLPPAAIGRIEPIRITASHANSLVGVAAPTADSGEAGGLPGARE